MALQLGTFGVWLNPAYDDSARVKFVVEAEVLGYTAAWLGLGSRTMPDLSLLERALDATRTITVASAIVNIWTNDAATVARSYQRIVAKHPDRFLLGVGIGHPESIAAYRSPLETVATYLDELEAGGVPRDRRVLAALRRRALELARDHAAGAHPYLVVPDHTRYAREILGSQPLLAPEHAAVVSTDPEKSRPIAREFVKNPYLGLRNYVNNLLRYGFTPEDVANGGSDRLIDALVLQGTPERIKAGLSEHLEAGANHVAVQILVAPGENPRASYRALARVLF